MAALRGRGRGWGALALAIGLVGCGKVAGGEGAVDAGETGDDGAQILVQGPRTLAILSWTDACLDGRVLPCAQPGPGRRALMLCG